MRITNAVTASMLPRFDPTQLLKVSWDVYQPSEQELAGEAGIFDISLDNVSLVTTAQANDPVNNCDPGRIGLAPGSGDAGSSYPEPAHSSTRSREV